MTEPDYRTDGDTMPDECPCGSRLYEKVWALREGDEHDRDHSNKHMDPLYRCAECGKLHATAGREVPDGHM